MNTSVLIAATRESVREKNNLKRLSHPKNTHQHDSKSATNVERPAVTQCVHYWVELYVEKGAGWVGTDKVGFILGIWLQIC